MHGKDIKIVGTVYLVQYILENSTVNIISGTTIAEEANVQRISIFGICEDVLHNARQYRLSLSVTTAD
jgi:hypothetical protein